MPACATQETVGGNVCVGNLILAVPDTDFREFLDEVEELARFAPEIIGAIEKDLDAYAREKKGLRLADKRFFESSTGDLPKMNIRERNVLAEELQLAVGRPRMPGSAVYVFLMIRGFLGSLTTKPARRFLRESMSLYGFLQDRGLSLPGATTILEANSTLLLEAPVQHTCRTMWRPRFLTEPYEKPGPRVKNSAGWGDDAGRDGPRRRLTAIYPYSAPVSRRALTPRSRGRSRTPSQAQCRSPGTGHRRTAR